MVVSKYGFGDSIEADASRVAAQIVSGIGFLGAGIIIYRKHEIHGLTTAAGVWATSGVGMAAGAGMYIVAAGATVILIGVQCIFHIKCKFFQTRKYFQVKICFVSDGSANDIIKELFQTDRFYRLVIERKGGRRCIMPRSIRTRSIPRSGLERLWRNIPLSAPSNVATRHKQ